VVQFEPPPFSGLTAVSCKILLYGAGICIYSKYYEMAV
jgi:hypothetical protein